MTDPARDFFQGADAIQRRPIAEAQMRDAVEALQRLELYRDAYSDLIAALAAQSGDSPSSIRQVVKARAEGSEKDLIDKLQGTLDLLTGGEERFDEAFTDHNNDRNAALRLCALRVAAAIGEQM